MVDLHDANKFTFVHQDDGSFVLEVFDAKTHTLVLVPMTSEEVENLAFEAVANVRFIRDGNGHIRSGVRREKS